MDDSSTDIENYDRQAIPMGQTHFEDLNDKDRGDDSSTILSGSSSSSSSSTSSSSSSSSSSSALTNSKLILTSYSDDNSSQDQIRDDDLHQQPQHKKRKQQKHHHHHHAASLRDHFGFTRKATNDITEDTTIQQTAGNKRQDRSYSDSENSYEHPIHSRPIRERHGLLDIDVHADGEWGIRSFIETMHGGVIESLVGWAHSNNESSTDYHQEGTNNPLPTTKMEENVLTDLVNDPLPLSYLNSFMLRAPELPEFHEKLVERFDTSALVAIGMIVEEIITATLLPFAGCHNLRCRQIENKPSREEVLLSPLSEKSLRHPVSGQSITFDPRNLDDDESAFSAWTLPIEEAIYKLILADMIPETGIPILHDPIRAVGTKSLQDQKYHIVNNRETCRRLFEDVGSSKSFLQANKNLHDMFIVRKKISSPRRNTGLSPPSPLPPPAAAAASLPSSSTSSRRRRRMPPTGNGNVSKRSTRSKSRSNVNNTQNQNEDIGERIVEGTNIETHESSVDIRPAVMKKKRKERTSTAKATRQTRTKKKIKNNQVPDQNVHELDDGETQANSAETRVSPVNNRTAIPARATEGFNGNNQTRINGGNQSNISERLDVEVQALLQLAYGYGGNQVAQSNTHEEKDTHDGEIVEI